MFHDFPPLSDDSLPTPASDGSVRSQQHDARGHNKCFLSQQIKARVKRLSRVLINVSLLFSPKKQTSKFPLVLLDRCEVVFDEVAELRFQLPSIRALLVYECCSHGSRVLHDTVNLVASRAGSQMETVTPTADYVPSSVT